MSKTQIVTKKSKPSDDGPRKILMSDTECEYVEIPIKELYSLTQEITNIQNNALNDVGFARGALAFEKNKVEMYEGVINEAVAINDKLETKIKDQTNKINNLEEQLVTYMSSTKKSKKAEEILTSRVKYSEHDLDMLAKKTLDDLNSKNNLEDLKKKLMSKLYKNTK